MDGSTDLRPLTGFKRSVAAKVKKEGEDAGVDTLQLQVFKDLCVSCSLLGPLTFAEQSTENVHKTVSRALEEGVTLPYKLKFNILMREVNRLVKSQNHMALIGILSPWQSERFDYMHPKVSGLSETASVRLTTWRTCVFDKVLCPLLQKGEAELKTVLCICSVCIKLGEEVDPVNLDTATALALDEINCICLALIGAGSSAVDAKYEECNCKQVLQSDIPSVAPESPGVEINPIGSSCETEQGGWEA
eukprot:6491831-Amphidinium_carterae.2